MGSRSIFWSICVLALAGVVPAAMSATTIPGPALTVDAASGRHPISPDIYGFNGYGGNAFNGNLIAAPDLRPGLTRWGGNSTSQYNWTLDATNAGGDFYYEVGPVGTAANVNGFDITKVPDGAGFDFFVETNRRGGAKTFATVPIMDWVVKTRGPACSFSVIKYGTQQKTDPAAGKSDCGNGLKKDGSIIQTADATDTDVAVDESFMAGWVSRQAAKYGAAAQGGVAIWSLDNEPVYWMSNHANIHPLPATYDEIIEKGIRYAAAIKAADPTAAVSGPVTAGYGDLFFSAKDFVSGYASKSTLATVPDFKYWTNPIDHAAHDDVDIVPWYLQQFAAYDAANGTRLLDYLDVHGYMPGTNAFNTDTDALSVAIRLQAPRVFWDRGYVFNHDDYKTDECVCLIPRMQDWIAANYPGTKTAITEYNLGGANHVSGMLAQADLLGVFGREGLDAAAFWGDMSGSSYFAFRLYRNYDGAGSAFGDISVAAVTENQDKLAIYAALRSDSALTMVVLNKTGNDLSSTVGISGFLPSTAARVYRYTAANLNAIVKVADVPATSAGVTTVFPAYSATLLVLPQAPAGNKPVVTSIANAASPLKGVAPGTLIRITGSNLGPATRTPSVLANNNGLIATSVAGVRVLFDNIAAPLLAASANSIYAVVPYETAAHATAQLQVEYAAQRSDAMSVSILAAAPAIFSVDGSGQGAAIAYAAGASFPSYSLISAARPAPRGSQISLLVTGVGRLDPSDVDGRLGAGVRPQPCYQLSATIGGQPASVIQSTGASGVVSGIQLVTVTVPGTASAGAAALAVTVSVPSAAKSCNSLPVAPVGVFTSQSGVSLTLK